LESLAVASRPLQPQIIFSSQAGTGGPRGESIGYRGGIPRLRSE